MPDLKPQYLFRPMRLAHRLAAEMRRGRDAGPATTRLPWGLELTFLPGDAIGFGIRAAGVFDLAVSEVVFRLTEPGATAVDVGAHVGYMTSIMAVRAGRLGRVFAYEAHPANAALLQENAVRWARTHGLAVDVVQIGVSNRSGTHDLLVHPEAFRQNTGTASFEPIFTASEQERIAVPTAPLDDLLPGATRIAMLKIDVEGHEPAVLEGARRLLRDGRVRDLVLEDQAEYPSRSTALLERLGFEVSAIRARTGGPYLAPPDEPDRGSAGPSLLATLDPHRARERLQGRGWATLGRVRPAIRERLDAPA